MNNKAIVTITIGDSYIQSWKRYCEPNWNRYAKKHDFDLILLQEPLDRSERARSRSVAWQKCLILSQPFASRYDRLVWIDSDILLNISAPDISEKVPNGKIGAVEDAQFTEMSLLERVYRLWPEGRAVINYTPSEYYATYGLPGSCDRSINTGVLVLSPEHRGILEHVYSAYEEKEGGRKWHMEQRPLSYELITSQMVHWLDPRFNVNLWVELYTRYPFLQLRPIWGTSRRLADRLGRKVGRIKNKLDAIRYRKLNAEAVNAVYQNSYFLHFASTTNFMSDARMAPESWWDVLH